MLKRNVRKINIQIVKMDKERDILAKKGFVEKFTKTYTKQNLQNLNTGDYWDEVFKNEGGLQKQSPMTKDKIFQISKFIPQSTNTMLDLGIGQGYLEELLAIQNTEINTSGIDISPHSIRRAKKNFSGSFIVGDILEIDKYYKPISFDVVVALELLEHISPNKVFSFYKKVHKVLKPEGLFIVSVPINESLNTMNTNPSAHVRDYSYEVLKMEMEINNFDLVGSKILYAFNTWYNSKKILAKILARRWKPNSLIVVAKKVEKKKK